MIRPIREPVWELEEKASSLSDTKIEEERRQEGKREKAETRGGRALQPVRQQQRATARSVIKSSRDSLLFPTLSLSLSLPLPPSYSMYVCAYVYARVYICIYVCMYAWEHRFTMFMCFRCEKSEYSRGMVVCTPWDIWWIGWELREREKGIKE